MSTSEVVKHTVRLKETLHGSNQTIQLQTLNRMFMKPLNDLMLSKLPEVIPLIDTFMAGQIFNGRKYIYSVRVTNLS